MLCSGRNAFTSRVVFRLVGRAFLGSVVRVCRIIVAYFNRLKLYMPGLKDFVVLVSDPGQGFPSTR